MTKITKLAIFDFDGTLIDTPLPDVGKKEYQEKTGKIWPYEGWWGRHESLDMEVFDMPVINDVVTAYRKEKANPETVVVMMTGRMIKLADDVKKILDAKGLAFNEYRYNTGGATEIAKMKSMDMLLEKYPDVVNVELWDDRLEHIPIFQAWGNKKLEIKRLTNFNINVVPAGRH